MICCLELLHAMRDAVIISRHLGCLSYPSSQILSIVMVVSRSVEKLAINMMFDSVGLNLVNLILNLKADDHMVMCLNRRVKRGTQSGKESGTQVTS